MFDNKRSTQPISLTSFAVRAWKKLLRPRNQILDEYRKLLLLWTNEHADEAMIAIGKRESLEPTTADENRVVRVTRLLAAWQVLWTSIIPIGLACTYATISLKRTDEIEMSTVVVVAAASLGLLAASSQVGVIVQSFLAKPFLSRFSHQFELRQNDQML